MKEERSFPENLCLMAGGILILYALIFAPVAVIQACLQFSLWPLLTTGASAAAAFLMSWGFYRLAEKVR